MVNAIGAQNLILPAGTAKIGAYEYPIEMNSSPDDPTGLNDLPIKTVNGATVFVRDVAHVRDGYPPQTNMVHVEGQRASLLTILKTGARVDARHHRARPRASCRRSRRGCRRSCKVTPLFDQSVFVRAAIDGVVHEAVIAAGLTALMILLFLGSWRSTLIVVVSIPLSILVSIIALAALGETLNVMTLGGLALAVGILVDDATVEIENIHRNLEQGKPIVRAILDGARADRGPGVRLDALHLHRLRAGVLPDRAWRGLSSSRSPRRSSSRC